MYFIKFGIGIGVVPVLVSPLIVDYSKKKNRGLSNAYGVFASTAGILSVTKILPFVSGKYGLRITSFVFAGIFFLFSLLILLLVKNPPPKKIKQSEGI
jgi:MFS family permease